MATRSLLTCVTLCACLLTTQAGASEPVLYYSFDELGNEVIDGSGNNNNGTPQGGLVLNADGKINACYEFNGTDSYVELQRVIQDDFVISAWIKTEETGPGTSHAYQGNGLFWSDVAGNANDFVVAVLGTRLSLFAGNPDTSVNSNGDIVTGDWVHITAKRDTGARTLSVYIDGQFDNSTPHSNTGPLNAQAVLAIGANTLDGRYYTGLMDEVVIFGRTLNDGQIAGLVDGIWPAFVKAEKPEPADGAIGVISPLLQWTPGGTARFHSVFLGTDPENLEQVAWNQAFALHFISTPLEPGVTYYWRVDEVEIDMTTIHAGDLWSFTTEPLTAYQPNPADEAEEISDTPVLAWLPGKSAAEHQVYLGTDRAAVADGAADLDQGTVAEATFSPGLLRAATTYYWRVDEVAADGTIQEGEIWSFTTVQPAEGKIMREWWLGIGGTTVSALTNDARYPNNPDGRELLDLFEGPTDWDHNYGSRLYGWLAPTESGECTFWIASDDSSELWLSTDEDPANAQRIASVSGYTNPREWTTFATQTSEPVTLQAGQRYYIAALQKDGTGGDNVAVSWQPPGGAQEVIPGSLVDTFGLPPLQAFAPTPANGAVDVFQSPTLGWAAGEDAIQHDVYFGDDEETVASADTSTADVYRGTQAATTYVPGALEWNKTYYWRIDEKQADGAVNTGSVWRFTTADFIPVDDFETYTNEVGSRIFQTWIDGLGFSEPAPGHPGNGSAAFVGHDIWTAGTPYTQIVETSIVQGGEQSIPLYYNNSQSPYYSETDRTFAPAMNWNVGGVTDLSIWVQGESSNAPGQFYVALSSDGSPVVVNGAADAVLSTDWIEWKVPLSDFAGVNLGSVRQMIIGVGDRNNPTLGGDGLVYIDTIRVVKPEPVEVAVE